MGLMLATFKIMPEDVDTNLEKIKKQADEVISKFGGKLEKYDKEPVAFGLVSLNLIISLDEGTGGLDPLEDQLRNLEEVESVEIVDVRRALG